MEMIVPARILFLQWDLRQVVINNAGTRKRVVEEYSNKTRLIFKVIRSSGWRSIGSMGGLSDQISSSC